MPRGKPYHLYPELYPDGPKGTAAGRRKAAAKLAAKKAIRSPNWSPDDIASNALAEAGVPDSEQPAAAPTPAAAGRKPGQVFDIEVKTPEDMDDFETLADAASRLSPKPIEYRVKVQPGAMNRDRKNGHTIQ